MRMLLQKETDLIDDQSLGLLEFKRSPSARSLLLGKDHSTCSDIDEENLEITYAGAPNHKNDAESCRNKLPSVMQKKHAIGILICLFASVWITLRRVSRFPSALSKLENQHLYRESAQPPGWYQYCENTKGRIFDWNAYACHYEGCQTTGPGWIPFCYKNQCFRRMRDEQACRDQEDGIVVNADGSWCTEHKFRDFLCPPKGLNKGPNPSPGNDVALGDIGFKNAQPHAYRQPCRVNTDCYYGLCTLYGKRPWVYCYGQRCISRKKNAPECKGRVDGVPLPDETHSWCIAGQFRDFLCVPKSGEIPLPPEVETLTLMSSRRSSTTSILKARKLPVASADSPLKTASKEKGSKSGIMKRDTHEALRAGDHDRGNWHQFCDLAPKKVFEYNSPNCQYEGCNTVPNWTPFCYKNRCFRRLEDEDACLDVQDGVVANADGSWCMLHRFRDFICPKAGLGDPNPVPGSRFPVGDIGFLNQKTPRQLRQPCTEDSECKYDLCSNYGSRKPYCYGRRCIARQENAPECEGKVDGAPYKVATGGFMNKSRNEHPQDPTNLHSWCIADLMDKTRHHRDYLCVVNSGPATTLDMSHGPAASSTLQRRPSSTTAELLTPEAERTTKQKRKSGEATAVHEYYVPSLSSQSQRSHQGETGLKNKAARNALVAALGGHGTMLSRSPTSSTSSERRQVLSTTSVVPSTTAPTYFGGSLVDGLKGLFA